MNAVLFLYATHDGQTRRICEAMADEVRRTGRDARLLTLTDAHAADAAAHAAQVVIGASIRYGHLPKRSTPSLRRNRQRSRRARTSFSASISPRASRQGHPRRLGVHAQFPQEVAGRPQRLAVFAGALRYSRYPWYDKAMIRFIMWITGGPTDPAHDVEFTNWEKVRAFGRTL